MSLCRLERSCCWITAVRTGGLSRMCRMACCILTMLMLHALTNVLQIGLTGMYTLALCLCSSCADFMNGSVLY